MQVPCYFHFLLIYLCRHFPFQSFLGGRHDCSSAHFNILWVLSKGHAAPLPTIFVYSTNVVPDCESFQIVWKYYKKQNYFWTPLYNLKLGDTGMSNFIVWFKVQWITDVLKTHLPWFGTALKILVISISLQLLEVRLYSHTLGERSASIHNGYYIIGEGSELARKRILGQQCKISTSEGLVHTS